MEKNWEENEYNWVKGNLIPEQLIDILCEQYVEGVHIRDNDDCDDNEGVEMTNMVDKVFENESDED